MSYGRCFTLITPQRNYAGMCPSGFFFFKLFIHSAFTQLGEVGEQVKKRDFNLMRLIVRPNVTSREMGWVGGKLSYTESVLCAGHHTGVLISSPSFNPHNTPLQYGSLQCFGAAESGSERSWQSPKVTQPAQPGWGTWAAG